MASYTDEDLAGGLSTQIQILEEVDAILSGFPLPIGRNEALTYHQSRAQEIWFVPFISRRIVGYFLSGLALSMGASFWFDQIKRVGIR